MTILRQVTCRHCGTLNPMVFFAPVVVDPRHATCLCFGCVKRRNWLAADGNLKPGVEL